MYLMCIRREYYNEDLEAKSAAIDATEQGMKRPSTEDGQYGKIDDAAFKVESDLR